MTTMTLVKDSLALFRREARGGWRDPGPAFVLPLMPPLLLLVVFNALFARIVAIRGFGGGTGEYIDYLAPGVVVLTALLGAGFTATSLALDASTGYLDRLRLLTRHPSAFLLGRAAFDAVRVLPAAAVVLVVGLLLGGPASNGVPGALLALALTAGLSAAYAGVFHAVALATRDPQTATALQPLGLVIGFLSTALVPAETMPAWAERFARANPASAVAAGARAALGGDLWSSDVATAAVVAVAGTALTAGLARLRYHALATRS